MNITIEAAMAAVDRFEQLLADKGIDVPRHPQTDADMLSLWQLLRMIREGLLQSPNPVRNEYAAALATHDLAAKVLHIEKSPQFPKLLPHLAMLAKGAVHLTQTPPATADGYNKLIEAYWACLCIAEGLDVDLDHPENSDGANPDVITNIPSSVIKRGYAFKTVRSPWPESIFKHLEKGIDQIEKSPSTEGVLALQLTPRMQLPSLWPSQPFPTYMEAAAVIIIECQKILGQVIHDNGQAKIDTLFANKKAVGHVLCIVHAPILAISPITLRPTAMPLKVGTLVGVTDLNPIPGAFVAEIDRLTDLMQTIL